MGRHRLEPVRPRYGRVTAAVASLAVTVVALLGGVGILPISAGNADQGPDLALDAAVAPSSGTTVASAPDGETAASSGAAADSDQTEEQKVASATQADLTAYALPDDSGSGRRVVFSQSEQRVWLVDADDSVERTYLVSGSLTDNLDPGTFSVYSRSEQAWGINDSGTMEWFVRFTTGDTGAAIGFHDIPVDNGVPVQRRSELGTPQSHGCIRQKESDAKALWDFAPLDTTVVVTA
ncbi:ErfK/YbiS/YcfS/YnhG family protein [metagenome]|uniref:ErfK/YbiS/YcfS/YnhG family protein n=1 Tax=metagenome TaxID=256318 RepID=A0A2P2CG75_9ZZZZ